MIAPANGAPVAFFLFFGIWTSHRSITNKDGCDVRCAFKLSVGVTGLSMHQYTCRVIIIPGLLCGPHHPSLWFVDMQPQPR